MAKARPVGLCGGVISWYMAAEAFAQHRKYNIPASPFSIQDCSTEQRLVYFIYLNHRLSDPPTASVSGSHHHLCGRNARIRLYRTVEAFEGEVFLGASHRLACRTWPASQATRITIASFSPHPSHWPIRHVSHIAKHDLSTAPRSGASLLVVMTSKPIYHCRYRDFGHGDLPPTYSSPAHLKESV